MKSQTLRHAVARGCLLLIITLPLRAQPVPPDDATPQQAELKMLRATVDRQAKELRQLHEELDALRAGRSPMAPAATEPASATRPATATQARRDDSTSPKRVVFVLEVGLVFSPRTDLSREIAKALNSLDPTDSFNIVYAHYRGTGVFQKQAVAPTEANKREAIDRLEKFSQSGPRDEDFVASVKTALQLQPTTLWIIADGRNDHTPSFWRELARLNDPSTGRSPAVINTASFVGPPHEPLWNLAHATGGICIDRSGSIIDHPAPNAAPPPKTLEPLPTGRSIFDAH